MSLICGGSKMEYKNQTKLTLNPEMSGCSDSISEVPVMQSIISAKENNFSAGTIDESMLSDEEKVQVEQFANEINIENVDQVANYGMNAQTNISDFSVSVLKKVKTYELGEVGDSLKDLTIALDATTEPEKKVY